MLESRAFDPAFLRRLDGLVLGVQRARTARSGRRTLGRVQGLGIEPENFREYNEGDDLRFLDWNTYARLDELTIRTFRAERQVEVTVAIDASASMGVPRGDDKLGLAMALGASLAYVAMASNEAVRLVPFAPRRSGLELDATPFRSRREMYPALRPFVERIRCGGETRLAEAVGRLLLERRGRGIIVLVTDLLVAAGEYEEALDRLLAARHEVKLVHVLGHSEISGEYPPGNYLIRDSETGVTSEVILGPRAAEACRRRADHLSAQAEAFCRARGVVYARAFGAANLDEIAMREFPRLGIVR